MGSPMLLPQLLHTQCTTLPHLFTKLFTNQLLLIPTPSQFQPTPKLSILVPTLTPTPSHMFWELEHQALEDSQSSLLPSPLKLKPKPLLLKNRLPEENETKIT